MSNPPRLWWKIKVGLFQPQNQITFDSEPEYRSRPHPRPFSYRTSIAVWTVQFRDAFAVYGCFFEPGFVGKTLSKSDQIKGETQSEQRWANILFSHKRGENGNKQVGAPSWFNLDKQRKIQGRPLFALRSFDNHCFCSWNFKNSFNFLKTYFSASKQAQISLQKSGQRFVGPEAHWAPGGLATGAHSSVITDLLPCGQNAWKKIGWHFQTLKKRKNGAKGKCWYFGWEQLLEATVWTVSSISLCNSLHHHPHSPQGKSACIETMCLFRENIARDPN